MKKRRITFEKATNEYAKEFYGNKPALSFRGYVALLDGKVVGVGGITVKNGNQIAFSEMKDEMRPFKKDIVRGARLLMEFLDSLPFPVIAFANKEEPNAPRLLERLGFTGTNISVPGHGVVFRREI
jgi:hypothetical protein